MIAYRSPAQELAEAIRETSRLVGDYAGRAGQAVGRRQPSAYPQLARITARFERINGILEKGLAAGGLTSAQVRSIGANFRAIGALLDK